MVLNFQHNTSPSYKEDPEKKTEIIIQSTVFFAFLNGHGHRRTWRIPSRRQGASKLGFATIASATEHSPTSIGAHQQHPRRRRQGITTFTTSSDPFAHQPRAGTTSHDGPERTSPGDIQIILPSAKER